MCIHILLKLPIIKDEHAETSLKESRMYGQLLSTNSGSYGELQPRGRPVFLGKKYVLLAVWGHFFLRFNRAQKVLL